jgi:hypothetical protein
MREHTSLGDAHAWLRPRSPSQYPVRRGQVSTEQKLTSIAQVAADGYPLEPSL